MLKNIIVLIVGLSFFVRPVYAQTDQPQIFTLKEAILLTFKNNLDIKIASLNEAISSKVLEQSRYALLPNLNFSSQPVANLGRTVNPVTNQYVTGHYFAINPSIGAQFTIYSGFQKINQIKENKILLDIDKTNKQKIVDDVTIDIINTYLRLLTSQELVSASLQQLSFSILSEKKILAEYSIGKKTLVDVSQAQSQTATAEYNVKNMQNELASNSITFKQLTRVQNTVINVIKPTIYFPNDLKTLSDTEILSKGKKKDESIHVEELKVLAALMNIRLAKSSLFPKIQLFSNQGTGYSSERIYSTGYSVTGLDTIGYLNHTNLTVVRPHDEIEYKKYPINRQFKDNFYNTFGITLQIPIFNNFQAKSFIDKANINYEREKLNLQNLEANIEKVIMQAKLDFDLAEEKEVSATNIYKFNLNTFNVISERYKIGLSNSTEYYSALNDLNRVQFDMIISQCESIFKKLILSFYVEDRDVVNYLQ